MSDNNEPQVDVESLSYEQARAELINVVQRLEAGGATLEESLKLWERGEELATRCQGWLDGAQAKLDEARERRASDEAAAQTDNEDEAQVETE